MATLHEFPEPRWTERLQGVNGDPTKPLAIYGNCALAFEESPDWIGALTYNELSRSTVIQRNCPSGCAGERWGTTQVGLATKWFHSLRIFAPTSVVGQAAEDTSKQFRFHPVRQYLSSLTWDGVVRNERWLKTYLKVPLTDFTSAVGDKWLMSAVARAFKPGCKADYCLILEGSQGIRKSTALRTLASDEFFSDMIGHDLSNKDSAILCAGAWIIEHSELESLSNSGLGALKAFFSRVEDHYRPPYGRYSERFPRQCVFAGTTNEDEYLVDPTGNRRFWPVRCTDQADIDGLARDRDQLWAEAVYRYRTVGMWWLEDWEEQAAKKEQESRIGQHPWTEPIAEWIKAKKLTNVSSREVIEQCPALPKNIQLNLSNERIISHCLRSPLIGFELYRRDGYRRYRKSAK